MNKIKINISQNEYLFYFLALAIIIFGYLIYIYSPKSNNSNNKKIINNNLSSEYNIIVGIDFGSTKSGYYIIFNAFNNQEIIYNKISSQIILSKINNACLYIGDKALNYLKGNKYDSNILYFDTFKKYLDPNNYNNLIKSDYPGDEIELNIIMQEYMSKMKEEIENQIKERNKEYNIDEIKWIISISPLLNIKQKIIMENIAKKIGISNLDIILEPQAETLYIFKEENKLLKNFIKNDKTFLIVDIGGYTIDFSANKISEKNNLEQIMIPFSLANGSFLINQKIFDIFTKFVGKRKIKEKNYLIIKEIMDHIEKKKIEIDLNDTGNLYLNIKSFRIFCKSIFGSIKNIFVDTPDICKKNIDGMNLTYDNNALIIPNKYILDIINQYITNIFSSMEYILSKLINIDLIIFTGGFINNKIFKGRINEYKKRHKSEIIFMKEPQLTVMKGTALFGLNQNKKIKRIIPLTLGVISYEKINLNEICDDEYLDINKKGKRCYKYLIFVKRNESIENNKIISYDIYIKYKRIYIFYSYENEITKYNYKVLGCVDANFNESNNNNDIKKINLTMKFNDYINISIIDNNFNVQNSTLLMYPKNMYKKN